MDQQGLSDRTPKQLFGLRFPIDQLLLHIRNIVSADDFHELGVVLIACYLVGSGKNVIAIVEANGGYAIAMKLQKFAESILDLLRTSCEEKWMPKVSQLATMLGEQFAG